MDREAESSEHAVNLTGIRFSLGLLAGLVLVAFLREAQAIVLPVLVAMFVAVLASPVVLWLEQRGVATAIAVIGVVCIIAVLGLLIGVLLAPSLDQFAEHVPVYGEQLNGKLEALLPTDAAGKLVDWPQLIRKIQPSQAISVASTMFNGVRDLLTQSMLIVLLVVFMLLDLSGFLERVDFVSPKTRAYLRDVASSLKRYFAIKTVISLCTGIAAGLLCAAMGLDFALLWGFLAFLLNYIPSIGSILAAIPAVALSFAQLSPGAALVLAAGYLAINVVMGNLVEPRVMGRGLGLSALLVFVSLVFWGWVLGPMGMLLSIPLTMVIKIALDANPRTRWISLLMGSKVPQQETDETPAPGDEPPATREAQ